MILSFLFVKERESGDTQALMRGLFQAVLSLLFVSTSSLLADLNNELIPLTLKQMARSDWLPESAEEATLLTELALDLGLPNSEASEGWP